MSELWWLWALCSSVLMGMMIYANQIFKMPSSLMMTYRGFVQSFILLLFFPFFEMPSDPWFWILGTIQGFFVAYSDKKTFLCSRLYGGEIVGSIKPYAIAFVFFLWLIIRPQQITEMLKEPVKFGMIIFCFGLIIFSLRAIYRGKLGREAFLSMLPALLVSVCIDVNNKYITTLGATAGLASSIFYYCWITAFFSGLPNLVKFLRYRDWKMVVAPRYIIGGLLVIFCSLGSNFFKNTAMYYTVNPAYASAVIALYPVWIIVWNNFYYCHRDAEHYPRCNFMAVGLLLAAVIALILLQ